MLSHPWTNFEILTNDQNEPNFNGIYSRNRLPRIKYRAYVINFGEYESIGTRWIALYVIAEKVRYFDIVNEIRKFIGNKILQQIFIEDKRMIQYCVYIFVLDLLISF